MLRLSFFLFAFLPLICPGQLTKKDWSLAATYDHIDFERFPIYNTVGLKGEYMLGKRVGVEFGAMGGKDNFHFGIGTVLAPFFLLLKETEDEKSLGELVLMLAGIISMLEHTNYHISLTQDIEFIPFLSLMRFRYMYDKDGYYNTSEFLSWSVGSKLSILPRRNWFLNGTIERSQLYYSGRPMGVQVGFNVGYIFKYRGE
jgi:hypothetical protein